MGLPVPASAQGAPTVTLEASDRKLNFGRSTVLSGRVTPEAPDQEVDIVDGRGNTLASATTDDAGKFKLRFAPTRNVTIHAEWNGMFSDDVPIRVKPLVNVNLGDVRLFDVANVWGRIRPGTVNGRVTLKLRRWGKVVTTRKVDPRAGGSFKSKFRIEDPGEYRVQATYSGGDHMASNDRSQRRRPHLPSLSVGSESIYVELLERRLQQLNYRLPGANKSYDRSTSDAMIAFNKVQGRSRVGYVTEATWYALASPKIPKPRFALPKYHIEVDQTKQVLYRVRNKKIVTIMHVSTGAGSATRDGTFQFWSKLAGYSSKRLYYPSFFDGARAIHGWPSVPTYNASHGCVRVPMWTAIWIFKRVENGDTIRIYH